MAEIAETSGALRAAISNAMVGLKAKWYGKGPERARTYLADDDVFVIMEGGLTRNEETLLAAGEAEAVRQYRLLFQAIMRETTMTTVAELTGRVVLDYHSQIVFDPPARARVVRPRARPTAATTSRRRARRATRAPHAHARRPLTIALRATGGAGPGGGRAVEIV